MKPLINKSQIRDVNFGKDCKVIEPVNLYECNLGNNVFIGPFVEIAKGVIIADNTKISSHSFVCELVSIGKNCFIGSNSVIKENSIIPNNTFIKMGSIYKN